MFANIKNNEIIETLENILIKNHKYLKEIKT